ncbi:MAG: hypothetical protein HY082_01070 [Gammaproteobacteria bacterium]|nr:hypothetical protein [Gammaproteobacteria bacterium]
MKGTLVATILGGMILLFSLSTPLWARVDADEAQLENVRKDIDKDWTNAEQADRAQSLAKQFNVDPGVVETLRAKKQGWGSVTIELAMAQHLTQANPNTYPTFADALKKIETMRSDKMGWGKIANDLGFKLGPVVSAAMHARNELRREAQSVNAQKVQKSENIGKPETAGRPESLGRPDHAGRPERPARVR